MEKKQLISGFTWRFLERFGAQGVAFIVSIILARLLDPDVYGLIALVTVFTTILQVFVDSGLANALIQKKDADDLDFSTVFYFNIIMCFFLYLILFILSPYIASFYGISDLKSVIRVLGLIIVISGVKNVQQAYVARKMLFKKFFFATLGGTIGAAVIGITMAYLGYGVWALVVQMLFNTLVDTVILWFTVRWRPKKLFSWKRFVSLFSYGWKLLVSALIDTIYDDLSQLIIGKVYSSSDLAYWNKGKWFPGAIVVNVNSSIDSVLFPAMSSEQDNVERVKSLTRRAIKTSSYIMMPMMVGLAVCAEPIVRLLLTDKWLPSVFFLRIFCISYAFYPIHTANLNVIKATGRSDIFLKLEIAKKIVGLAAIVGTMWISVEAMAYGFLASSFISILMNSFPNKKLIGYSLREQLKDILPSIALSAAMGSIVFSITFLHLNDWITLLIQVTLGVLIYYIGSKAFHLESFEYVVSLVKGFRRKTSAKGESAQ